MCVKVPGFMFLEKAVAYVFHTETVILCAMVVCVCVCVCVPVCVCVWVWVCLGVCVRA